MRSPGSFLPCLALQAMTYRLREMTSLVTLLSASTSLLGLPTNALSTDNHRTRRMNVVTDPSDEGDPYTLRLTTSSFKVVLSPTPDPLSQSEERLVYETLQQTVNHHGRDEVPEGSTLDFVLLGNVQENIFEQGGSRGRRLEPSKTILLLDSGTASFQVEQGTDPPQDSQVEDWVSTAVETLLLPELQKSSLNYITKSEYQATTFGRPTLIAGGVQREQANGEEDQIDSGVIAGAVVGSVLAVALIVAALLIRRRRQKDRSLKANVTYEMDDTPAEPFRDEPVSGTREDNVASVDARYAGDASSAGSVSEWTASSSFTSKSVDTRHSLVSPIGQTESFELDRQVMLRKDMLYTSPGWDDNSPLQQGNDETVLKPSHFSAKKERKLIRQEAQAKESIEFSTAPHWNPADSTGGPRAGSPFLFEANGGGEQMYIIPPGQTQTQREEASESASQLV